MFFRIGDPNQTLVNHEIRKKSVSSTTNKTETYYCDEFIVTGELYEHEHLLHLLPLILQHQ